MRDLQSNIRKRINYADVIARDQELPSIGARVHPCAPRYITCTDSDDPSGGVNPLIRSARASDFYVLHEP